MAEAKKIATKEKKAKTTKREENSNGANQEGSSVHTENSAPEEVVTTAAKESTSLAKAGKRSAKAQKETEEKQAKEERKAQATEEKTAAKEKPAARPTRSKLERQGKKFREVAQKIEKGKAYSPEEALELATQTSPVRFDATVELHVNLNVDPKQADQNVRDNLVLPAGTGKNVRIAVFTDDKVDGADFSGIETITKALEKGELNFDVLIATPANMPKLGKYARLLGPRGLMPNPKSGTVTTDVARAVSEAKAGRVEYRVDSTGIVHLGIGKVSFGKDKLLQNYQAVLASIKANKPANLKGSYIQTAHLSTSMGPSISVNIA